ncbi:RNA polymerase sigma factor [Tundrisphaera sp. TA3]|uniref:RNA polymerase sigma factor n=1 Tax=Tundrisphaera sp. TA3 TaxID=3435775 RepID=UPI003EB84AC4
MASGRYGPAMAQITRLFGPGGTAAAVGERSLLDRFARDRDGAAFEALVSRHGPMVLGVCRRALDRPDEVDDAFQATFLVLARRAGSIRDGDRLGPWLHGVARRVAARARARAALRRSRERPFPIDSPAPADAVCPVEADELRRTLDDELGRLPEKYRVPLVLCYLEGLTHDEAATRLGWPVGTVRSRLAGGRDRLRSRLSRLGLSPSAGLVALRPGTSVPEALISATAQLATAAGSSIPTQVAHLMSGALLAMYWNKLMTLGAAGLIVGLAVGGASAIGRQGAPPANGPSPILSTQDSPAPEKTAGAPPGSALVPIEEQLATEVVSLKKDLASANERIERLEQELAIRRNPRAQPLINASPKSVSGMGGMTPKSGAGGMMAGGGMAGMGGGVAPSPSVTQIARAGASRVIVVRSGANDRITMIDTATQKKATFQMPRGAVTQMRAIFSGRLVIPEMSGPAITRAAIFDLKEFRWSEHELKDPATSISGASDGSGSLTAFKVEGPKISRITVYNRAEDVWSDFELKEPADGLIQPFVAAGTARYEVGRFLYIYSAQAKKWSVLERSRSPVKGMGMGMGMGGKLGMDGMLSDLSTIGPGDLAGEITIVDGDVVHIYDPKTGDWTHISTKDDQ